MSQTVKSSVVVSFAGCVLFIAAILLHSCGIFHPFLGNFAQHQTDYATVVQRWLATSIEPLHPVMRFMALGKNRLFYGDFPLNITMIAYVCKFTNWPIEAVGRGLSMVFFILSIFPLTRLISVMFRDRGVVRWTIFFYVFSPLTLIYGQSFLLEMTALSFSVFGYYYFFRWYRGGGHFQMMAAAIFFSMALATRIYYAPILLPIFLLLCFRYRFDVWKQRSVYIFFMLCLLAPFLWQSFAGHKAAIQGDESSLRDNLRVFLFQDPILKANYGNPLYYVPILKTVATKLATPLGLLLCFGGLFCTPCTFCRQRNFILIFLLSFLPLAAVSVRKYVEFEYYFMPMVVPICVLAALGLTRLRQSGQLGRLGTGTVLLGTMAMALIFSLAPILKIPDEDRYVLDTARKVREIVPENDRVIASHGSSTSFLYYTDHDGWAFSLKDQLQCVRNQGDCQGGAIERLERFCQQGAAYFALADKRKMITNPAFYDYLAKNYDLVYDSAHSLIYSLRKTK